MFHHVSEIMDQNIIRILSLNENLTTIQAREILGKFDTIEVINFIHILANTFTKSPIISVSALIGHSILSDIKCTWGSIEHTMSQ